MIKLKNVSKFYYSKGMITSGFSRVNLSLDVGEFVVITGESGSGKSTLLNVISGLDSYEEGEMYIEGRETSHYLASDFEEYRKKYIGNIFQNFNLVGSYSVYQNVDLILRINGYPKDEIKARVDSILERVGLADFAKTKVSKLSGGQKQRVAIARALAKDTAIVVADEPTGNLDSESAEGIVQLLREISRDKLVVVVTHNYEQFEEYATRRIKMHDGKIIEDEVLQQKTVLTEPVEPNLNSGKMSAGSKVRLGLRNTFNIIPKFILLLIVFLFVVLSVTSEYTSLQQSEAEMAKMGYNYYFENYSEDRIVVKKADSTDFTEDDYEILESIDNVKSIVKEDMILDDYFYIEDDDFSFDTYPMNISYFEGQPDYGRLPENKNEVLLQGYDDGYFFGHDLAQEILDKKFKLYTYNDYINIKVVGVDIVEEEQENFYFSGTVYFTQDMINENMRELYILDSKITTTINGNEVTCEWGGPYGKPVPLSGLEEGKAIVPEDFDMYYDNGKCTGHDIDMEVENMFYKRSAAMKIQNIYNDKNFESVTGFKKSDLYEGVIFVSYEDYYKLIRKAQYQASVYMENIRMADETETALENAGFVPLTLLDTLMGDDGDILTVIQVPMMVVMVIAIFFIAYFVIQLILRSRTSYFGILRMLGLAKRPIRRLMDIELFVIVNIAYGLFLGFVTMVNQEIVPVEYIQNLTQYMKAGDYIILYVVLIIMSYLISGKFVRKMFKKTAIGSFREED